MLSNLCLVLHDKALQSRR
ncbi:hypothetical protein V1478_016054 [Vespula squamosa]|uniref:Uncharacterized protein n=1 Tax=Vespula squamosa TaxID=30214 RepID=A0ABD2A2K7_VESSQ